MILSGKEIHHQIKEGNISIDPFHKDRINPNSYNLQLHSDLLVYDSNELDMKKENKASMIKIPEEGLLLQQNKLYLGRTIERTKTKKYGHILNLLGGT